MSSVYILGIESNYCNYEIWINDIRVDIQTSNHPASYSFPINQWLLSDISELEIIIKPLNNSFELHNNAYLKTTISVCSVSLIDELENCKEISCLTSPEINTFKINSVEPLTSYKGKITFKTNEIVTLFNKAPKLQLLSTDFYSVQNLYKEIFSLFQNKDELKLLRFLSNKTNHYASVYNERIEKKIQRTKTVLRDLFSKKIGALNFEGFHLQYYSYKRIVCLEDKDGDQPLFFTDDIDDLFVFFPLYFARELDSDEWKIVL